MGDDNRQVKEPSDAKSLNLTEDGASALESNASDSVSTMSSLADSISAIKFVSNQQSPDGCYGCSNSEAIPICLNSSSLDGKRPEDTASMDALPKDDALATNSVDTSKLDGLDFVNGDTVGDLPSNTLNEVPPFDSGHQSVAIPKRGFVMRKFSSKSSADVDICPRARRDITNMSNRRSNRNWDGNDRYQFKRDGNVACLKEQNIGPIDGYGRFQFNRIGTAARSLEFNHGSRDSYGHFQLNKDGNAVGLKEPNHGRRAGSDNFQFNSIVDGAGSRITNYGLREGCGSQFNSVGNGAGSKEPNHDPIVGYSQSQFNRDGNAAALLEPNYGPRDCFNQFQFNRDGNSGWLKEPNRGPRAWRESSSLSSSSEKEQLGFMMKRDSYNLQDFPTIYDNAKFFVIKSYSEDDVQKSIKYNVWSSTPNGNKKLDAAFQDARTSSNGAAAASPLFLFFSVNGSGQFLGVAEMIGQVDFKKDMDFWRGNTNKWNGFFPIKWHIIKDVPNSNLRHIILENNDNRPVTFTRDTQEIEFKQGIKMLTIFKNYCAKTSMLDDFKYYDEKEKTLHEDRYHAASTELDSFIMEFPQHSGAGVMSVKDASSWSESSFSSETFSNSPF